MIAFIIENENPFSVEMTRSALQALQLNLEIIPIQSNKSFIIFEYLSKYTGDFFLVLTAGEIIYAHQVEKLLTLISLLKDQHIGIAHNEQKKILPILWRKDAVLAIDETCWKRFAFADYFFYYLYAYLNRHYLWMRVNLRELVCSQVKEPKWKQSEIEWELLYPFIFSDVSVLANVTPAVSIVICTYNDAEFLNCAIYSVLIQSNPNWELVIINDGSTDNTNDVLCLFHDDPRITVIKNDENKGKSVCLNSALSIVRGEWFLELDADDWLNPNCVEQLLQHHGKDIVLIYGDNYEWKERYNKKVIYSQIRKAPTTIKKETLLDNPLPIAPRMYNIPFLKKIDGWNISDPYNGRLYEDIYMLAKCMIYPILHVPIPLYHRRIRRNSITQREKGKFINWIEWFREENDFIL